MITRIITTAILSAFIFQSSVSRAQPPGGNEPLTSSAEFLRQHGIDTSQQSLIAALRNNDPTVRSIAAFQLAGDHPLESTAILESALSNETDPDVAVQIAGALWQIGGKTGFQHLESVCADPSLPMSVVTKATWHLTLANRSRPQPGSVGKCAGALIAGLGRASERDRWPEILLRLLAVSRDVPKAEADVIVSDIQTLLGDNDPSIRMAASHALATMASVSSIPSIRNTISYEQDPDIRASLERDLSTLEKAR